MTDQKPIQSEELIRGTHGTSVSRWQDILKSGFQTSPGRVGTGVYLWVEGEYAEKLAKEWYFFRLKRGIYAGDQQPEGIVLMCKAIIQDPGVLDLEDRDLRQGILSVARSFGKFPKLSENEITRCYDVLIQLCEKESGKPFQAVIAKVPAPPGSDYPIELLGAPDCFIVRDPSILEVERELPIHE